MIDPGDILFVGLGASAPCYYRCLLPAHALGADYVGLVGDPPDCLYLTGLAKGQSGMPDLTSYRVLVVQQAHGEGWRRSIEELQRMGVVVIYELDDHLHAIARQRDHDYRQSFTPEDMRGFEVCMKQADGMIVSTPYLAKTYRKFNKRIWICENGIDPERYAYTRPAREMVNILWCGATGHRDAAVPWFQATAKAMAQRPNTGFVSIGQPFAEGFAEHFGRGRALSIPWCAIEQYPAAMTMGDIALAPAANNGFFLGKSDLRWLEASALGIPIIGHPLVYRHIKHGVNGFTAHDPRRVEQLLLDLIDDAELRTAVGQRAKEEVLATRTFRAMAPNWAHAIEQAVRAAERRRAAV